MKGGQGIVVYLGPLGPVMTKAFQAANLFPDSDRLRSCAYTNMFSVTVCPSSMRIMRWL